MRRAILVAIAIVLAGCTRDMPHPFYDYSHRDFAAELAAIPRAQSCGYRCQHWFEPGHMVPDDRGVWNDARN